MQTRLTRLWEIRYTSGKKSYLWGSFHAIMHPAFLDFPPALLKALESVDIFLAEINYDKFSTNETNLMAHLNEIKEESGRKAKNELPSHQFELFSDHLIANGFEQSNLDNLCIYKFMYAVTLTDPISKMVYTSTKNTESMDTELWKRAKKLNKITEGMEDNRAHINALAAHKKEHFQALCEESYKKILAAKAFPNLLSCIFFLRKHKLLPVFFVEDFYLNDWLEPLCNIRDVTGAHAEGNALAYRDQLFYSQLAEQVKNDKSLLMAVGFKHLPAIVQGLKNDPSLKEHISAIIPVPTHSHQGMAHTVKRQAPKTIYAALLLYCSYSLCSSENQSPLSFSLGLLCGLAAVLLLNDLRLRTQPVFHHLNIWKNPAESNAPKQDVSESKLLTKVDQLSFKH